MVSIDFFTVPTITLKVLFVFIVLEHRRREVLHFNVTDHATAAWTSQQIVEAFAEHDTSRYLLRDRDGVYGSDVRLRIFAANRGNSHGAPQPLAASIRRAAHRLDPQRVSGPLHHP
jgi:membrane protease subunit (stomatin/prohibitin family)